MFLILWREEQNDEFWKRIDINQNKCHQQDCIFIIDHGTALRCCDCCHVPIFLLLKLAYSTFQTDIILMFSLSKIFDFLRLLKTRTLSCLGSMQLLESWPPATTENTVKTEGPTNVSNIALNVIMFWLLENFRNFNLAINWGIPGIHLRSPGFFWKRKHLFLLLFRCFVQLTFWYDYGFCIQNDALNEVHESYWYCKPQSFLILFQQKVCWKQKQDGRLAAASFLPYYKVFCKKS